MAGIKITDLTQLTDAVSADLLYIVDVSDTTQSPQGTSKQIELGDIVSSGTFDSTTSASSGFNDLTTTQGVWTKIGDTIHYGCKIDFTLSATGIGLDQNGQFDIDFPEKVNNFSDDNHSFQLTISEGNPNTLNKTIVNNDLKATINVNSIATGDAEYVGYLYLTAIYTI